jgi:hypothetical protein
MLGDYERYADPPSTTFKGMVGGIEKFIRVKSGLVRSIDDQDTRNLHELDHTRFYQSFP